MIRGETAITVITEACPAPEGFVAEGPFEPTQERIDQFVALLAGSNCDMTIGEAPIVLPANGFEDRNETRAISRHLQDAGLMVIDYAAGVIRLIGEACPTE